MYEEITEEQVQKAKDELSSAINTYYSVIEPDSFVEEWVLVTHKRSIEWEQENTSVIGVATPTGQSWVVRRGMLEVACDGERKHMDDEY